MGIASLKYLSQIQFQTGQAIYELEDATPSGEQDLLTGMAAGFPEPLFMGIKGAKPRVRFSTPQVGTFLGIVNTGAGAPFVAAQSGGNTDLWYQDATNLLSRTAAGTAQHQRFRMTDACVYWSRIGGRHQEDAMVEAEILPIYDGTNNPLQYAGTLALPGSPIGTERYTMGPVKVNGTMLGGVQEWQLNSGVKANEEGSEGDIWLTWAGLDTTQPVLEITGRTVDWWNSYGPGTAVTSVTAFLIKKSTTGNYANGATQHISITGTAGIIVPDQTSGKKSSTKLKIAFAAQSAGYTSLSAATGVAIS